MIVNKTIYRAMGATVELETCVTIRNASLDKLAFNYLACHYLTDLFNK